MQLWPMREGDENHNDEDDKIPDNVADFVPVFPHGHPEVSHVADPGHSEEQVLLSEGVRQHQQ